MNLDLALECCVSGHLWSCESWDHSSWDPERVGWAWPRALITVMGEGRVQPVSRGVSLGQGQEEARKFRAGAKPRQVILGCVMVSRAFQSCQWAIWESH